MSKGDQAPSATGLRMLVSPFLPAHLWGSSIDHLPNSLADTDSALHWCKYVESKIDHSRDTDNTLEHDFCPTNLIMAKLLRDEAAPVAGRVFSSFKYGCILS